MQPQPPLQQPQQPPQSSKLKRLAILAPVLVFIVMAAGLVWQYYVSNDRAERLEQRLDLAGQALGAHHRFQKCMLDTPYATNNKYFESEAGEGERPSVYYLEETAKSIKAETPSQQGQAADPAAILEASELHIQDLAQSVALIADCQNTLDEELYDIEASSPLLIDWWDLSEPAPGQPRIRTPVAPSSSFLP